MRTGAANARQDKETMPGTFTRCNSGHFRRRIRSYHDRIVRAPARCRSTLTLKSHFMPYSLVWEPDGVLVEFSGPLTARELIHSTRQLQSDPRFDEVNYVINDLSVVTGHQLSDEALRELSALNYGAFASHPNCRIVYVTTDEALAGHLDAILMAPEMVSYEIRSQPTVSAARDWLDSQPQLHLMSNVMGFRVR